MKKNFLYNLLLTGSNLLFPLLTFPYLSRVLGAEGLGICNFIISYGQNYLIIAALGIQFYGSREIAKLGSDIKKRSQLFFELLSIHLLFTFILLSIYIASIFIYADLKGYKDIALIGSSFIFLNVFSIEWLFTGVNNFKYITIRSLIIRFVSIIAIFLLVKGREDLKVYFIIMVLTVFFTVSVDVYYAKEFISRKIKLTLEGVLNHIRPIFILGIYIILNSFNSALSVTLLGFLSSKVAVGYFYSANKIVRMIISVFSALVAVMVPRLNLVFEQKGKEEYILLINKSLDIVVTLGIPITVFVFLLANPIVNLLAGKDFQTAILLVRILAPIIFIVAFAQIFVLLILSVNRKDNSLVILSALGMVIGLLINVIFIRTYAEKATAFSQLCAEFFVTLLSYFFAKRTIKFHFPFKKLFLNFLYVIPFALFSTLVMIFTNNQFLQVFYAASFCGIYFFVYQLFFLKNDLIVDFVEKYYKKFKKKLN